MGCKIRDARKAHGIKQGEFARMLGVTNGAVSQWEKGKTLPGRDKLIRISEILDIPLVELLTDEARVG